MDLLKGWTARAARTRRSPACHRRRHHYGTRVPTRSAHPAMRVLLIEDDPDAACAFGELLELEGYSVCVEQEGALGMKTAMVFRPHVLLCDLGLPGLDGYGVAAAFRRDPLLRGAVLFAVSGDGSETARTHALQAGFDDHLTKPIDVGQLLDRLRSLAPRPDPSLDERSDDRA